MSFLITTPEFKAAWEKGLKELFYPYGKTLVETLREQECGPRNHIRSPIGEEKMSEPINHDRRRFLGAVAMGIAATQLLKIDPANAQTNKANPAITTTNAHTSFSSLKQIDAGILNAAKIDVHTLR